MSLPSERFFLLLLDQVASHTKALFMRMQAQLEYEGRINKELVCDFYPKFKYVYDYAESVEKGYFDHLKGGDFNYDEMLEKLYLMQREILEYARNSEDLKKCNDISQVDTKLLEKMEEASAKFIQAHSA